MHHKSIATDVVRHFTKTISQWTSIFKTREVVIHLLHDGNEFTKILHLSYIFNIMPADPMTGPSQNKTDGKLMLVFFLSNCCNMWKCWSLILFLFILKNRWRLLVIFSKKVIYTCFFLLKLKQFNYLLRLPVILPNGFSWMADVPNNYFP